MGKENNKLVTKKSVSFLPQQKQLTNEELVAQAQMYFKSGLAPEHLKNFEAVFIAMTWAAGLGIHTTLGLRDIFVIDNIPSLRTEAALALVEISGFCEYIEQEFTGKPYEDDFTAVCKIKMKGRKEHVSTFSVADAKRALLWNKRTKSNAATAWVTYPKRMLMYRAVGFALRDVAPHVLRGAKLYEEVIDYNDYEIVEDKSTATEVNVVVEKKPTPKSGLQKLGSIMDEEPPETKK